MRFETKIVVICSAVILLFSTVCSGLSTRCFVCNSRGELGDCKDPFTHNATSFKDLPGNPVGVASCPSGWCRKQMEIVKGAGEDYGGSTERHCLQIPPRDNEERCAKIMLQNKPTLLCMCRGDLCNSSVRLLSTYSIGLSVISTLLISYFTANLFLVQ